MQTINLKTLFKVQLYLWGIVLTTVVTTVVANTEGEALPRMDIPGIERPRYAPDRIIFKLAESFAEPDDSVAVMARVRSRRLQGIMERNRFVKTERIFKVSKPRKLQDIQVVYLPPGIEPKEAIERLQSDPDVEWAEPDYYRYTSYTEPNDEYHHEFIASRVHLDAIEAQSAWDVTTGDPNIIIAVIDTGVHYNHPDLFDNIWVNPGEVSDRNGDDRIDLHDVDLNEDRNISQEEIDAASNGVDDDGNDYDDDIMGWDFVNFYVGRGAVEGEDYYEKDNNPDDFQGHGTMVAGAVSAVGNNGIGVMGVTWNSRIMILRSGFSYFNSGAVPASATCSAIAYAIANGADIINISSGGYDACRYEHTIINSATDNDCIIVASAGNDNNNKPLYPSSYEEVISIASTYTSDLASDTKVFFSNYGLCIDVAAPGVNVETTYLNGEYYLSRGTSLSSPIVAGVAALVKSSGTALSSQGVTDQIIATCDNIDHLNPSFAGRLGAGRLNARKAVDQEFSGPRPNLISKIAQYIDDECEAGKTKAELYASTTFHKFHD